MYKHGYIGHGEDLTRACDMQDAPLLPSLSPFVVVVVWGKGISVTKPQTYGEMLDEWVYLSTYLYDDMHIG